MRDSDDSTNRAIFYGMFGCLRDRLLVLCLLCFPAGVFIAGITWGLPSRRIDPFLFGDQPVWSGKKIAQLAGDRSGNPQLGADVDATPLDRGPQRRQAIVVNETDRQRAEIIRRFRLYTYQPDEMITMMSLASMKPSQRDFDPKLYQYGGLWIYPVGAMLKAASMVGLIHLAPTQTYYLDHPEAFGRFYVVARAYVVLWAIIGAAAICWLAYRFTRDRFATSIAVICYALMPVVVNMAHEAKPHLPAAVLILLTVIAATKYIDTGLTRWWILVGILCGAAMGMVLSALPVFIVPVMMVLFRKQPWPQRITILLAALVIGIDAYLITNPYVPIHLLHDHTVLLSNLRNSQAMYQTRPSLAGLANAAKLVSAGTTVVIAVVGAVSSMAFVRRRNPSGWMLGAVSIAVLIQFALLATGKPGEYARFALLPDIALGLAAVIGVTRITRRKLPRVILLLVLALTTGFFGAGYLWHFGRDAIDRTTRQIAAERLRTMNQQGASTLALAAEPAPYSLPPVDLFKWKLVLMPAGQQVDSTADVAIRTVDAAPRGTEQPGVEYWTRPRLADTPISWASKPWEVRRR